MENKLILAANQSQQIIEYDDDEHLSVGAMNTEIVINENASLELYILQNVNDEASIAKDFKIKQLANSRLKIVVVSFNGGDVRNSYTVDLDGEGAETEIYGLYLVDKKQHTENHLKVNHNVPHCTSNEKFKGILDDEATAVFNGHVYVAPGAQKTDAQQNNSNILLTSTAKINTQPFLEIYADDVKCSHGTSTGQLDQEAMFYMRQRGISKANARMLLMYAFAAEVSNHIGNDMLREHIDDMIKRRLRGELSSCETCVLRCSHPKEYNFDIDYSKI
ncbi:MAG: Fe-S cluster assembly protein SufD [Bacteroidales bacterium]|nr:Fe-S cluster assembly protein SufD [Bacteroidales bacterium]